MSEVGHFTWAKPTQPTMWLCTVGPGLPRGVEIRQSLLRLVGCESGFGSPDVLIKAAGVIDGRSTRGSWIRWIKDEGTWINEVDDREQRHRASRSHVRRDVHHNNSRYDGPKAGCCQGKHHPKDKELGLGRVRHENRDREHDTQKHDAKPICTYFIPILRPRPTITWRNCDHALPLFPSRPGARKRLRRAVGPTCRPSSWSR